jgi:DnaK suppressor protein
MTPKELGRLRGLLEAREGELDGLVRNRQTIEVEMSADMIDQIQQASERDVTFTNLERDSARLREVRAALRRIHLGTFGICFECDEPISLRRLLAVPWTSSCLVCQEIVERNGMLSRNATHSTLLRAA